jgi:prophage regulatory protein
VTQTYSAFPHLFEIVAREHALVVRTLSAARNFPMSDDSILRVKQVGAIVGLGRTTIWALIRAGKFPPSVQLAGNRVGWRSSEIQRWVECRPRSGALSGPVSSAKAKASRQAPLATATSAPIANASSKAPKPTRTENVEPSTVAPGQRAFSFE